MPIKTYFVAQWYGTCLTFLVKRYLEIGLRDPETLDKPLPRQTQNWAKLTDKGFSHP